MGKYLLLVLLFAGNFASAQTVQSSCNGPDSLYRDDAQRLALRYTFHTHSSDTANAAINPALTQRFRDALMAVYNAAGLPARDTVVAGLHIHTFPNPTMNGIDIQIDTSYAWANNLFHQILPTGNPTIDQIIQSYGLTIDDVQVFGSFGIFVVFTSDSNYNLLAVNQQLLSVPGVLVAELNAWCCDGSDVLAETVTNDYTTLTYKYGGGDCPAGCTVLRYWRFTVTTDCQVTFDTVYGSQLDVPVTFDGIHQAVEPNGVLINYQSGNVVCVSPPGSRLDILSVDGRLAKRVKLQSDRTQVDVSALPDGVYVASVTALNGQTKRLKFSKR